MKPTATTTQPSASRKRKEHCLLLGALVLPPAAAAYSTRSSAHPFDAPFQRTLSETQTLPQPRVRYSLGIGKSGPVGSARTDGSLGHREGHHHENTYDAVRFLVEHDAVVDYPSPSLRHLQRDAIAPPNNGRAPSAKARAFVRPRRFSPDLIDIQHRGGPSEQPRAFASSSPSEDGLNGSGGPRRPQWELNTPWVEMLIHDQELQFQAV